MKSDILELHGFRAIAIMLVVFFHYSITIPGFEHYNNVVASGWMGVSLFFILSGFLLALPFINAAKNNDKFPDVITFYKKRLLRILPLYYFFFFLFIIYNASIHTHIDYKNFVYNLFFFGNHWVINPVIWSLKVEVKFYLFMPLIMLVLHYLITKKYYYGIALFLLAGIIIPLFYRSMILAPATLDAYRASYTSTISNFDSFFYGITASLIYIYLKDNKPTFSKVTQISISVTIMLACLAYYILAQVKTPHSMFQTPYLQSLLDINLSIIVLLTLMLQKSYWNRFLSSPFMIFIATISYGIYIYHFWIRGIVLRQFPSNPMLIAVIGLAATLIISTLSYKYLEAFFIKKQKKAITITK